jgi:hypothetical protein
VGQDCEVSRYQGGLRPCDRCGQAAEPLAVCRGSSSPQRGPAKKATAVLHVLMAIRRDETLARRAHSLPASALFTVARLDAISILIARSWLDKPRPHEIDADTIRTADAPRGVAAPFTRANSQPLGISSSIFAAAQDAIPPRRHRPRLASHLRAQTPCPRDAGWRWWRSRARFVEVSL